MQHLMLAGVQLLHWMQLQLLLLDVYVAMTPRSARLSANLCSCKDTGGGQRGSACSVHNQALGCSSLPDEV
jgi:hypothetical protein